MSSDTTPLRDGAPRGRACSVVSPLVVHIFPAGVPSASGAGRNSRPVSLFTTISGSTSVPIGVSFSSAPVMPTTSTQRTGTASRSRSVPAVASSVPIPVTIATIVVTVERPFVHRDAADLRLGERERARERRELDRHREHEGDPAVGSGRVHRASLPDRAPPGPDREQSSRVRADARGRSRGAQLARVTRAGRGRVVARAGAARRPPAARRRASPRRRPRRRPPAPRRRPPRPGR